MPLFSGKCHSKARLDGMTAIVTGSNTGIGKETVLDFFKRGARVIMACRNLTKAEEAKADVIKRCEKLDKLGEILIVELNLTSLASVRKCAENILATEPKINLLINNAGIICPQGKTEDGFEIQIGTNHLAHFLFTLLLLPRIRNSTPARIVNVSSLAHSCGHFFIKYATMDFNDLHFEKRPYKPMAAYGQSKLANVLFTKALAKKLSEQEIDGINVYSLHPGAIATEIHRHFDIAYFPGARVLWGAAKFFVKSPESGAQTSIYCAVDEKCAKETGLYYSDCVAIKPSKKALNPEIAEKLWDVSIKLVGLEEFDPFTSQDQGVVRKL